MLLTTILSLLFTGVSVHWLGDFVFVESGVGVRVKFDLSNTVYVTVTAEHLAATRGLCGVYNNNADGEESTDASPHTYTVHKHTLILCFMFTVLMFTHIRKASLTYLCLGAIDDFTTMAGTVSQYAASFGNSWKVPDQQNEVLHWIHWMSISLFCNITTFLSSATLLQYLK